MHRSPSMMVCSFNSSFCLAFSLVGAGTGREWRYSWGICARQCPMLRIQSLRWHPQPSTSDRTDRRAQGPHPSCHRSAARDFWRDRLSRRGIGRTEMPLSRAGCNEAEMQWGREEERRHLGAEWSPCEGLIPLREVPAKASPVRVLPLEKVSATAPSSIQEAI